MTMLSAQRFIGVGLAAVIVAAFSQSLAAEPIIQSTPTATTTYFPPSGTTGAIPTEHSSPATAATTPAPNASPATAAVTPPASEPPKASEPASGGPASGEAAKPADAKTGAPPTATAIVSPPVVTAPAASGAAPSPPPVAAAPPPPPVNPVVEAARKQLQDKSLVGRQHTAEDVAAAADFYNTHVEPLWTKDGAYTEKAKGIIAELKKADDWGLDSSDFEVPALASGASVDAQGAAEARLTLAALKYARFARGGRLDPVSLSNILDMKPPVKEARVAMRELAEAAHPGVYLRELNPHHPGFEKLRQALLKARGPEPEPEEPTDPALLVKIPDGKVLKPGMKDEQVALLRKRLKVPADDPGNELVYDDALVDAVRAAQREHGLRPDGLVGRNVRAALNNIGEPKKADPGRNVDRLIANMERWRWLPVDLGHFYVMNNIPEFTSEIWKDGKVALSQRMIVGQPAWPTPVLAAKMQFVIFHPSWGMPDGIKAKELLPRLRSASSSGFGFFDQLFGGGGSGGAQVLEAYKLQVYYNGHQIDPNSVDWNTADIRRYSFTQPPGADNPLGLVKFRFPNSHDVYMHDTPERGLFSASMRALSHGCMRVQEPRRTAEVILAEDKGYSPEKVGELWDSGANVTLDKPVPVYLVYFTARVGDDGRLATFQDIYGNDERVMAALRGHPVRYVAPEAIDPTESDQPGGTGSAISDAGGDDLQDDARPPPPSKKGRANRQADRRKAPPTPANTLQNALSNIFLN